MVPRRVWNICQLCQLPLRSDGLQTSCPGKDDLAVKNPNHRRDLIIFKFANSSLARDGLPLGERTCRVPSLVSLEFPNRGSTERIVADGLPLSGYEKCIFFRCLWNSVEEKGLHARRQRMNAKVLRFHRNYVQFGVINPFNLFLGSS